MIVAASSMPTVRLEIPALGVPPEPVLPLTVEQYHDMIRAGILLADDPIELLEGWLVKKMPKHPPHSISTTKTRRELERIVPMGWSVDSQEPITTADCEPEPDAAVIRGQREDYADRHPGPEEIGMLVEIADSSLPRDRNWKKRIYAKARVPVYWIVNLIDRQVEVFSRPAEPGDDASYAAKQVFFPGDEIPVILDDVEVGRIAVDDVLPASDTDIPVRD